MLYWTQCSRQDPGSRGEDGGNKVSWGVVVDGLKAYPVKPTVNSDGDHPRKQNTSLALGFVFLIPPTPSFTECIYRLLIILFKLPLFLSSTNQILKLMDATIFSGYLWNSHIQVPYLHTQF